MPTRRLETEIWLPQPLEEVFGCFSDASNLEAITPPWLHFKIVTPSPISMHQGALIDYRLRLRIFPIRWRTLIHRWQPPHRFTDTQLRGPYLLWYHEHTFEERDGGTFMRDRVRYRVAGWLLEPLIHRWFVRRDLERIFQYRQQKIQELLGVEEQRLAPVRLG